jgi:hypothetical protein
MSLRILQGLHTAFRDGHLILAMSGPFFYWTPYVIRVSRPAYPRALDRALMARWRVPSRSVLTGRVIVRVANIRCISASTKVPSHPRRATESREQPARSCVKVSGSRAASDSGVAIRVSPLSCSRSRLRFGAPRSVVTGASVTTIEPGVCSRQLATTPLRRSEGIKAMIASLTTRCRLGSDCRDQ